MKIKIDENIPASIVGLLENLGHDVDTVTNENLNGKPDSVIWEAAQKEGRFLITQDLDFADIRKYTPGKHCGILIVRLWMPGRASLVARINSLFKQESVESWNNCFIVLSDSKLRISRPTRLS